MDFLFRLVFAFLIIACTPFIINGQADTCVKKGPCVCEFANGTGIDLTPASKDTFFSAQIYSNKSLGKEIELSTYYYHPCYDVKLQPAKINSGDSCDQPLSICRLVYTMAFNTTTKAFQLDSGVYNFMGKTNDSTFSTQGESIVYPNLPSDTVVLLVCAETDGKLEVSSLAEPNSIQLSFFSRSACLKTLNIPDESGRSFGSTLLIIFFSLTIFYLVLGIGTKKFLMGATGVEVIPNLAFWTELPNLVKDGWVFMLNGFKVPARGSGPALSPDPNSYDSI